MDRKSIQRNTLNTYAAPGKLHYPPVQQLLCSLLSQLLGRSIMMPMWASNDAMRIMEPEEWQLSMVVSQCQLYCRSCFLMFCTKRTHTLMGCQISLSMVQETGKITVRERACSFGCMFLATILHGVPWAQLNVGGKTLMLSECRQPGWREGSCCKLTERS